MNKKSNLLLMNLLDHLIFLFTQFLSVLLLKNCNCAIMLTCCSSLYVFFSGMISIFFCLFLYFVSFLICQLLFSYWKIVLVYWQRGQWVGCVPDRLEAGLAAAEVGSRRGRDILCRGRASGQVGYASTHSFKPRAAK